MKKFIVSMLVFIAIAMNVTAQTTVVVERPGIFTDLATAIVGVPAAAAVGIVEGVVEAGKSLVCGSTTVVTTPTPVVPHHVVTTSPLVFGGVPSTTVVTTTPPPVVVAPTVVVQPTPTTTIVRQYGNGVTTTVTRPASGYELGTTVVTPVAPGHAVGPNPLVNPYIYRPHGF